MKNNNAEGMNFLIIFLVSINIKKYNFKMFYHSSSQIAHCILIALYNHIC